MSRLDRRTFLKLAGAGSAVAGAGGLLSVGTRLAAGGRLAIRASGRLPAAPYPAAVTKLVEGTVDLSTRTGLLVSRVLRGHPEPAAALPGSDRLIRIKDVKRSGSTYRLAGVIDDRSLLRAGEPADVEVVVDLAAGKLTVPFAGSTVVLPLDHPTAIR